MPESTRPVITILYHYLLLEEVEKVIKPKLEKLGWEVLILDDNIDFNGSCVNISAFYSLQKRDPNSVYTKELHKILFNFQVNKIERSDAILAYNVIRKEVGLQVSPEILMGMTISYYLKKPLYTWFPHSTTLPYYHEMSLLSAIPINEKLENITIDIRKPVGFLADIVSTNNNKQKEINDEKKLEAAELIKKKLQLKRKSQQVA